MTWMLTWQHFLEVRPGTCVESWVGVGSGKKPSPNSQHKIRKFFLHKVITTPTLMCISHIKMVSWGSKVGPSPPCWELLTCMGLGTHMSRPLSSDAKLCVWTANGNDKVDEANSVTYFLLLISHIVTLIQWMSNTCWFSCQWFLGCSPSR